MRRATAAWQVLASGTARARLLVDGLLAGVLGGLAAQGSWSAAADRGVRLDAVGFALVGVAAAALVVRRRWPLVALLVSSAATLVFLVVLRYPYGPILQLVSVAAYSVAAWCDAAVSATAVGAVIGLYAPLAWWRGGTPWPEFGVLPLAAVWLVVPWLVGVAVRGHRRTTARAVTAERRGYADEQRLRIAREVHDVVGHSLAVINLQAGVALHVAERRPQRAVEALEAVRQTSGRALADLRAALDLLSAPDLPVLARLGDLVATVSRPDLRVELVIDGTAVALPAGVELAGYRIVQESLTNVVRHAAARRVTVRLAYRPRELVVTVTDDGRGGAVPDDGGRGVPGMRQRAAALGGTVDAGPQRAGGFEVRAVLPTGDDGGDPS